MTDGNISVQATLIDNAGNSKTVNNSLVLDTQKPDAPIILSIVDINSDLVQIIISGTADEVGNTIKVYDSNNNLIGTSIVLENGTWSLNLSSLSLEQRYSLKAVEIDLFLNVSDDSNIVNFLKSENSSFLTQSSDDYIFTGKNNDLITFAAADTNNTLVIDGGSGSDTVSFRNLLSSVNIDLNNSIQTVANDKIEFRNIENVYGSETADDTIIGDENNNFLYGGRGNDTLRGGEGDDYLLGDQGALKEDNNDDVLYGDEGNDTLVGGHGKDTLFGGDDNDSLHGQRGNDTLIGGAGDDLIKGDGGLDVAVFSGNPSDYTFTLYGSSHITSVDNRVSASDGNDSIHNVEYFQFANRLVSTSRISSTSIDLLSTSDSGNFSNDNVTNDKTPTFRVNISSSVETEYIVSIYANGVKVGEHIVNSNDVTNGYVNITVNEFTSDNTYLIRSSITNILGFEGSSSTPLSINIDTNADSDNNFSLNVLSSDDLTNANEANDISVSLSGVDSDAFSINIEFTDGINSISKAAVLIGGVWTVTDTDISSLNNGSITVTANLTDNVGNTKVVNDTLILDKLSLNTVDDNDNLKNSNEQIPFSKDNDENIDFKDITITNSIIDLENSKEDILKLNTSIIFDYLNENNELIIKGDEEDKIILQGGIKSEDNINGKWEISGKIEDEEGHNFNIYQSENGNSIVKLLIEEEIDINNI